MESPLPDVALIRCSRALAFDREARCVYPLAEAEAEGLKLCQNAALRTRRLPSAAPAPPRPVAGRTVQRSELQPVLPSKNRGMPRRNRAGNSYEVCLTTKSLTISTRAWIRGTFIANFFQLGAVAIASSSPERFSVTRLCDVETYTTAH